MAVILDAAAQAVIESRRRRGKTISIHLRIERGSLRAYTPFLLVAGWIPGVVPEGTVVARVAGNVDVYMEPRVARYTRSRDIVVSGLRLWRWHRLALADPFAYEHMREWEHAHRESGARYSASAVASIDLGSPTDSRDNVIESTVLAQARSRHAIAERERDREHA